MRSPVTMLRAGPCSSQTTESAASGSAVTRVPVDRHTRVELVERLVEPGRAAEHCRLACNHTRDARVSSRDQLSREVAVAKVFRDGSADDGCHIGGNGGR